MTMVATCPTCSTRYGVRDEHVGKKVKCPKCKAVLVASVAEPAKQEEPKTSPTQPAELWNRRATIKLCICLAVIAVPACLVVRALTPKTLPDKATLESRLWKNLPVGYRDLEITDPRQNKFGLDVTYQDYGNPEGVWFHAYVDAHVGQYGTDTVSVTSRRPGTSPYGNNHLVYLHFVGGELERKVIGTTPTRPGEGPWLEQKSREIMEAVRKSF